MPLTVVLPGGHADPALTVHDPVHVDTDMPVDELPRAATTRHDTKRQTPFQGTTHLGRNESGLAT